MGHGTGHKMGTPSWAEAFPRIFPMSRKVAQTSLRATGKSTTGWAPPIEAFSFVHSPTAIATGRTGPQAQHKLHTTAHKNTTRSRPEHPSNEYHNRIGHCAVGTASRDKFSRQFGMAPSWHMTQGSPKATDKLPWHGMSGSGKKRADRRIQPGPPSFAGPKRRTTTWAWAGFISGITFAAARCPRRGC